MGKNKTDKLENKGLTRRSWLNKIWLALGVVALVEIIAVVIAFLRPDKSGSKSRKSESIQEAGHVDQFANDSVTAFVRGRFYLCRLKDGGFLAISSKCTHLGCTVPWVDRERKFACPCHGSAFDITGEILSSPAPRALDYYHLSIENNIIKVDTGKKFKRDKFNGKQVVYAKRDRA